MDSPAQSAPHTDRTVNLHRHTMHKALPPLRKAVVNMCFRARLIMAAPHGIHEPKRRTPRQKVAGHCASPAKEDL